MDAAKTSEPRGIHLAHAAQATDGPPSVQRLWGSWHSPWGPCYLGVCMTPGQGGQVLACAPKGAHLSSENWLASLQLKPDLNWKPMTPALSQYWQTCLHNPANWTDWLAWHGTAFQRRVWQLTTQIPWGATATYGQLAQALGQPNASRAVGRALSRNPFAPIIPCHRIIGQTGHPVGYAWGVSVKLHLLAIERAEGGTRTPTSLKDTRT